MSLNTLRNALSRSEMKTIMAGSGTGGRPICAEYCQPGPVVDSRLCTGSCSVCAYVAGNTICVTSVQ
jgi:hypothetical protein